MLHRTKKAGGARRALSLVEVLVALLLISFGLFGVVDLYMQVSRTVARDGRKLKAQALAHGYLAQLQAAGYGALDSKMRGNPSEAGGESILLHAPGGTNSTLDSDFRWNCRMRKSGGERIRLEVHVSWGKTDPALGGAGRIVKEVGYVSAP